MSVSTTVPEGMTWRVALEVPLHPRSGTASGWWAWLRAVLGGGQTPPLWARLLEAALIGGWTDEEHEVDALDRGLVAASALAEAVYAPAGERLARAKNGLPIYTTKHDTLIWLEYHPQTGYGPMVLSIQGRAPATVLRRALAAAEGSGLTWQPSQDLVDAALAQELAALNAGVDTRHRVDAYLATIEARGFRTSRDIKAEDDNAEEE